jgi:hypothetical protein
MLECPMTASRARRPQERNVTQSSGLEARSVGGRNKIQRRVRTTFSAVEEEGMASLVPGGLVDSHGSLESLLVVPNGLENRREWRSEESDRNDLFGLSVSGTGPEALNTYSMGTSILYTVFSRKADQYQAKISQDWKAIALNGTHLRNLLL